MSRYSITRLVEEDLNGIWDYIGIEQCNPEEADRIVESLYRAFGTLASFPYLGTLAADVADILPGIRMFPEPPYKVYYVPKDGGIQVIRVVHSRQHYLQLDFAT